MPSTLKYFKKDPNDMLRGSGKYYKRGAFKPKTPFKLYKGAYFSKFDAHRDMMIKAKGWEIDKVGRNPKNIISSIAQAGDGKKRR